MKYSHFSKLYSRSFSLLTDLYQLTMAYGYWKSGLYNRDSIFHLFFRKSPFQGNYAITSGLSLAIDYLQNLSFAPEDIHYLARLKGSNKRPLFDESFLNYLQRMEFSCDIDAIPEGTIVFPNQPLLRVKGPLIQAQLIETALLNFINFSTLISTKASRIVQAAQGDTILEFGLRRAQGVDGGLMASRASYIGGCHATSNVLAGQLYDIPVKGTHAHSWVMCFDDELTAFQEYAKSMPHNCIFLVDTYDTIEGVENAIKAGRQLRENGHDLLGIRLDSGDLTELSIIARKMLDKAGFQDTQIVASNDLDEFQIKKLKEENAQIRVWGVGTRLATAYDQPALGGVYKLAAITDADGNWDYKMKLSEQAIKISNPGQLQVRRFLKEEQPIGDFIFNSLEDKVSNQLIQGENSEPLNLEGNHADLLKPIFRSGQLVYQNPDIHQMRDHCLAQQKKFADISQKEYPNGLEQRLFDLKQQLIKQIQS